jgi:hypothetical protein
MAVLDNKKPQPTSVSPVKPQRKGTGFTNLARIMQANQGSRLGQTISGGITGQAQQVQSGIKTAQDDFQKEAELKRIDSEENRKKATNAIGNIINPSTSGSPISGPSSADLSLFKTIREGEYKGPTELANQQQLQAQAQQAQTLGSLASGVGQRSGTDQGGRQELLRRFVGGADYTSGQRKLDESILSKDKESNLASAARQTRGVAEEAQRATSGAQAKGQEYGKLAGLFKKEISDQVESAQNPFSQQINTRVSQIEKDEVDRQAFLTELNRQSQENAINKASPRDSATKLNQLLQLDQYKKYIPDEIINSLTGQSDNFINRAVSLGKDPSDMLLKSILAKSTAAQNISRGGIVASDQNLNYSAQKIDALSKLLGREGSDLEFSRKSPKYEAGKIDSGLTPFKKELYTGEKLRAEETIKSSDAQKTKWRNDFMAATGGFWSEYVKNNPDGTVTLDWRQHDMPKDRKNFLINAAKAYNRHVEIGNKARLQSVNLKNSLDQIDAEEKALAVGNLPNT